MKRFIFLILTGTILGLHVHAQELKRTQPDFSDYIPLLNAAGYEVFTFDLSSLKDDTYNIEFVIREYADGVLVSGSPENDFRYFTRNRRMLSDFPEEVQKEIISEGHVYDLEKGILALGEKLSIGFTPSADSLKNVSILLENMAELRRALPLKPLTVSPFEGQYSYGTRPFEVGAIELGEFTPLVMFGSYWYDDEAQVVRFCGEDEIAADLSTTMLSKIPHYYVLGITVTK
jgi:hypothetical protein